MQYSSRRGSHRGSAVGVTVGEGEAVTDGMEVGAWRVCVGRTGGVLLATLVSGAGGVVQETSRINKRKLSLGFMQVSSSQEILKHLLYLAGCSPTGQK